MTNPGPASPTGRAPDRTKRRILERLHQSPGPFESLSPALCHFRIGSYPSRVCFELLADAVDDSFQAGLLLVIPCRVSWNSSSGTPRRLYWTWGMRCTVVRVAVAGRHGPLLFACVVEMTAGCL